MGTWKLNHAYESYRDGIRFGPWAKGDLVNLDDADAAWVERDSAGALSKVDDKKVPEGPAVPVPAAGARPRVGGDPDRADAATAAQERVHADARARQAVDELQEDDEEPARQHRSRDRQHRGRNRSV
jgi:hypothetical protein